MLRKISGEHGKLSANGVCPNNQFRQSWYTRCRDNGSKLPQAIADPSESVILQQLVVRYLLFSRARPLRCDVSTNHRPGFCWLKQPPEFLVNRRRKHEANRRVSKVRGEMRNGCTSGCLSPRRPKNNTLNQHEWSLGGIGEPSLGCGVPPHPSKPPHRTKDNLGFQINGVYSPTMKF